MTTVRRGWPTRIEINFQGKAGEIALDQIRTRASAWRDLVRAAEQARQALERAQAVARTAAQGQSEAKAAAFEDTLRNALTSAVAPSNTSGHQK